MGLSTLKIQKRITPYNRNIGSNKKNEFIVIHYFGSLGTAQSTANYFYNSYIGASAQYCLDATKTVYQCVEDKDIAWHVGNNTYIHKTCRNTNSIGIEVKPEIVDATQSKYAEYKGWYFSKETMNNLVELTQHLMEKYNIPVSNVIRHFDVTGKWCPRPLMGTDTNIYYKTTGNKQWDLFKERLALTMSQYNELKNMITKVEAENKTLRDAINILQSPKKYKDVKSLPEWAKVNVQRLVDKGVLTGVGNGNLNLSEDLLRSVVLIDRVFNSTGVYNIKKDVK